jgi:hypothetical protein
MDLTTFLPQPESIVKAARALPGEPSECVHKVIESVIGHWMNRRPIRIMKVCWRQETPWKSIPRGPTRWHVEAAGIEPFWRQIHNLVLAHDLAA